MKKILNAIGFGMAVIALVLAAGFFAAGEPIPLSAASARWE